MTKTPIFYYHSIGNKGPETLSANIFRTHLELLTQLQFTPITFSQLIKGQYDIKHRNAVLTFDDGLIDNYDKAFPILKEFGFKATFFIIAGFDKVTRWVNPKTSSWSDFKRDGYTIPFPSMQNHHREELIHYGMEIGSHSLSHPKLNKISLSTLKKEIFDSKTRLENSHGIEISSFCFPKGRYNNTVLDLVEKAGFQGACTTVPGFYSSSENRFECGRFLVENPRFFRGILELAISNNPFFENTLKAIRPMLKLKNSYF